MRAIEGQRTVSWIARSGKHSLDHDSDRLVAVQAASDGESSGLLERFAGGMGQVTESLRLLKVATPSPSPFVAGPEIVWMECNRLLRPTLTIKRDATRIMGRRRASDPSRCQWLKSRVKNRERRETGPKHGNQQVEWLGDGGAVRCVQSRRRCRLDHAERGKSSSFVPVIGCQ
jgi:hypothetical protein